MREPCKLFFNFLCNSFFFAHPGLGGTAGIALDSQWDGYSFLNLKWNQQQRSCPTPRQTLPTPTWARRSLKLCVTVPSLCLCTPASLVPLTPLPAAASALSAPPPPIASSSLLLPSYISSLWRFQNHLMSDFCLWLSSHHLLCIQFFKYDSAMFQSHHLAKWMGGCTDKLVMWLYSNLPERFSLSLLLCSRYPLLCSWNFQPRW